MVEARKAQDDGSHADYPNEPGPSEAPTPVITFRDVSHRYRMLDDRRKVVLDAVNLNLFDGERIALVGANGAGKSTLLKLIAGLERPTEGDIHVLGQNTRDVSPERLADDIALITQTPQRMFIEDSIRRDVGYYLKARNVPDADARVSQILDDFGLTELAERDGRLLSGGQMRRASLAIGAGMRPTVMLLDEPTSSLDRSNRRQIVEMLGTLERWVKTVIIATHDMEMVAEWAERIIVLREGRVIADAPPETIFGDTGLVERARIRPPQVIALSNALDIHPVRLSVDAFIDYLMGDKAAEGQKAEADVR
jgi:energy-coupling factor transport system ATP-binding protein